MQWNSIAATAKAQVDKFGAPVVIKHTSAGSFDTSTGVVTPGGTTSYPVKALLSTKSKRGEGMERAPGTLVQGTHLVFLVAASSLSIVPVPGDVVVWAGKDFVVLVNEPVFPGGEYLLHRLKCEA